MRTRLGRLPFAIGGTLLAAAALGALLFPLAGRWDLPSFWVYVAMYAAFCFAALLLLDPGLMKERLRPGPNAHDKAFVAFGKILFVVHYVVAALDVGRFHWTDGIPAAVQASGLVLATLSAAGTVWTMKVNRFFSPVIRIQEERGHHLVTDGPYRVVRHPGYLLISVLAVASGPALGSWLALIPVCGFLSLLVRRTALEDRFLLERLEGYAAYAGRVRHRLIPGVW